MKILIFIILTSSFIPQFAMSSTLESQMYEGKVKLWETMTKLKGTIDRINLHHRFSEGDERLFKDCKWDLDFQVKVCLNVAHIKINCYGYQCKIVIEYFLSKTIPRLDTMDKLDFDGYVILDYISNGMERRKTVEIGHIGEIIGPNQFDKPKGFKELFVFFNTTSEAATVKIADISFNIKSIFTMDKPTQSLGSSN